MSRADFWAYLEDNFKEVSAWPKWMRGGSTPDYRSDGNFYCADECKRCGSVIYTHAMAGMGMLEAKLKRMAQGKSYKLCDWCAGLCTAAEQDRRNLEIEGMV